MLLTILYFSPKTLLQWYFSCYVFFITIRRCLNIYNQYDFMLIIWRWLFTWVSVALKKTNSSKTALFNMSSFMESLGFQGKWEMLWFPRKVDLGLGTWDFKKLPWGAILRSTLGECEGSGTGGGERLRLTRATTAMPPPGCGSWSWSLPRWSQRSRPLYPHIYQSPNAGSLWEVDKTLIRWPFSVESNHMGGGEKSALG